MMSKSKILEICYIEDLSEDSRLHISFDFKQIVFLNKNENFIINM